MRYRISGVIGVLWGGFILLNYLTGAHVPSGEGAYRTGQNIGLWLGVLMFVAGLYYLILGGDTPWKKKKKKKTKAAFRPPSPPPDL